ncbi:MAG: hypothetical protein CMM91_06680 [Rickettsiales bacterium]|nr:hypothetical protein [Rickettsiales bacterium]|tara:strand:+ start:9027 stop:9605 length:579 start_codon:yes stop_codon:yes gene_type:complete
MAKDSKFHIDLNKAKNFFKKKMEKNFSSDSDSEKQNFRDYDEETIKISKLSARIDFLKDSLGNKQKRNKKVKIEPLEKKSVLNKKKVFIPSLKNKDVNKRPLRNYIMDVLGGESNECVIMKDFEINQKLYLSGNVNHIPENLIKLLVKDRMIRLVSEKYEQKKNLKKTYFVKETFGISELKRSKLRNNKKFK